MTNKTIKNYHKNKAVLDAANDTANIMCIVLLTAHKLFPKVMYRKAICRFIEMREEYCTLSDRDEQDDVFDYKIKQACDEKGIETADCIKIVKQHMHPLNDQILKVYTDNVRLLFVQLSNEHGLGRERQSRLIAALLSDEAETNRPLERIIEMGGEIEAATLSQIDYKKYRRKPTKTTYREQQQAAEGLRWLRAYQDRILKEGD